MACEPLIPIRVQNNSTLYLKIYIRSDFIGEVKPNDEIRNNVILSNKYHKYLIIANSLDGAVFYSREFTYEELKAIDYLVIISSPTG